MPVFLSTVFRKIKANFFFKIPTKYIWDLQVFSIEWCEVLERQNLVKIHPLRTTVPFFPATLAVKNGCDVFLFDYLLKNTNGKTALGVNSSRGLLCHSRRLGNASSRASFAVNLHCNIWRSEKRPCESIRTFVAILERFSCTISYCDIYVFRDSREGWKRSF